MKTLISSSLVPRNAQLQLTYSSSSTNSNKHSFIITPKNLTIFKHRSNLKYNKPLKISSQNSLLSTIFNSIDHFISEFMTSPLPHSLDPKHVLSGNFSPVAELPPTACSAVEGSLPSCLDGGAYIRNGPNPSFIPKGPYHFMEGDGMLHMIKFSHGKPPTFCCHYVNTHKLTVEREAGHPFVPSILSSFNGGLLATVSRLLLTTARVFAGQFDPIKHGLGPANTSLALISSRLYALCEADLPYAVDVTAEGDVKTLGRHDFGASEPFFSMTAHPKIDRATGEAFAYTYGCVPPSLKLFRIDSSGRKQKCATVSTEEMTVVHDFAVTENYAVIPDMQIVVDPAAVLRGRSPVGVDRKKVARVGIIPKYAEDEGEMVWVEAAGFNPMHCVNAWEEDGGDTVCMVASNAAAVDQLLENIGGAELKMEKVVVNVKEKTVERFNLSPEFLEFGAVNPAYYGKKNRYVYAAIIDGMRLVGVVKLDLSLLNEEVGGDCTVACRRYGSHGDVSEPFFVEADPNNPTAEEDDGYLVAYVHDDNTQESKFIVMDARSPMLEIIAAVKLPQRIPTGFHGIFLTESDILKLREAV